MLLAWPTPRMPTNTTAATPMRHPFASFTELALARATPAARGTEPAAKDDVLVERRQRVNLCLVQRSKDDRGGKHCRGEPGPAAARGPGGRCGPGGHDADQREEHQEACPVGRVGQDRSCRYRAVRSVTVQRGEAYAVDILLPAENEQRRNQDCGQVTHQAKRPGCATPDTAVRGEARQRDHHRVPQQACVLRAVGESHRQCRADKQELRRPPAGPDGESWSPAPAGRSPWRRRWRRRRGRPSGQDRRTKHRRTRQSADSRKAESRSLYRSAVAPSMKSRDRIRAPARPANESAAAANGGYSTGAPEKYAAKFGIGVPYSQCVHSRCPAHRYRASSPNAVFDQISRSDSRACTASIATSGHGPRVSPCQSR